MSQVWKVVLTLAVLLPVGGFLAGMLTTTVSDPAPRETIVISDDRTPEPQGGQGATGSAQEVGDRRARPGERFIPTPPEPQPPTTTAPTPPPVRDDGPRPVVPSPVDIGDDDDRDDDEGGDDDDDDDGDGEDDGEDGDD